MPSRTQDIAASNSLADLAARIRAEHEAAAADFNSGLRHAIAAGELLIEAKAQIPHGQWLPWLKANCAVSERTAQAYMRVARGFKKLDGGKSATVADFSFRDALRSLSATGSILNQLAPESYDRALAYVEDHDEAVTWQQAAHRVRIEDIQARNRGSLETPRTMLPSPNGCKIRVARNPAERRWLLALGPSITRAALMEKKEAALASPAVQELQREHSEVLDRAAELEAEAKALREDAKAVDRLIEAEIKKAFGSVTAFTTTYDFVCDETTDAELAALPQEELVDLLLSARGSVDHGLEEIDRGYWGDMQFRSLQSMPGGPGAWTKVGSPGWLDELFPNWNQPDDEEQAAKRECVP